MSIQTSAPESLKESFDYLYKTYFGELQIEKDEMERLPKLLNGCELFIDVGASLGMYTYFANKILDNAEIIAVEADPDRFRELEKNCVKWETEGSNRIKAVFAAAGDSRDTLEFFKTGSHISGSVFTIPERSDTYERVVVPQIMLDDYYLQGRKTFVKIDVEGAEYRVMEGATRLIEDGETQFAIGIHSWGDKERKKTPMDLLRLLFSKNLSISKTSNHMTSNYLFEPATCSKSALFVSYMKYTPMLLFRQIYRWAVPRPVGRAMEKMFNALRQRRFAS
ncbi:MAG: FkbM family methyltransferase [Pseudomonadota bacterium]